MLRRNFFRACSSLKNTSIGVTSPSLVVPGGLKPQWSFKTYRKGAMPMSDADSKKLEALYTKLVTSHQPSLLEEKVLLSNGHVYNLFFSDTRVTQTNVDTKKERRLMRTLVPESTASPVIPVSGRRGKVVLAARQARLSSPSRQPKSPIPRAPFPNLTAVRDAISAVSKGSVGPFVDLVDSKNYRRKFHSAWDSCFPANSLFAALRAVGGSTPTGLRNLAKAETTLRRTPSSKVLAIFPKKTQSAVLRNGGSLSDADIVQGIDRLLQRRIGRQERKYTAGARELALIECVRSGFARLRYSARRGAYDADATVRGSALLASLKATRKKLRNSKKSGVSKKHKAGGSKKK